MALTPTPIPIPMSQGIDEETDQRVLPAPMWKMLQNIRQPHGGAFEKRPGNVALTTTGAGYVVPRRGGSSAITASKIYTTAQNSTATPTLLLGTGSQPTNSWVKTQRVLPFTVDTTFLATIDCDVSQNLGLSAILYQRSATNQYTFAIYDTSSEAELVGTTLTSTNLDCASIRFVQRGGVDGALAVFRGVGANIFVDIYNQVNGVQVTTATTTTLITDAFNDTIFDVWVDRTASTFFVAYVQTATSFLVVKKFNSAVSPPTLSATYTSASVVRTGRGAGLMCINGYDDGVNGSVAVSFQRVNGGNFPVTLTALPLSLAAATFTVDFEANFQTDNITHAIAYNTAFRYHIAYQDGYGTRLAQIDAAGDPLTITGETRAWIILLSNMWWHAASNRFYAYCYTGPTYATRDIGTPNISVVVVELGEALVDYGGIGTYAASVPYAVAQARSARFTEISGNPTPVRNRCNVAVDSSLSYSAVFSEKTDTLDPSVTPSVERRAMVFATLTFDRTHLGGYAAYGDRTIVEGGLVCDVSNGPCEEVNFVYYPTDITVTDAAVGTTPAGTYSFLAIYTFSDGSGNNVRSAFNVPESVTVAANRRIDVTVPQQLVNRKFGTIKIELYMTAVSGTIYYFIQSLQQDFSGPSRTFQVNAAPNTANRSIVPTAGLVNPMCPPGLTSVVTFGSRVVGIGPSGLQLWFSATRVELEATSFADEFTIQLDLPSRAEALAVLDDKLIIFTENKIAVLSGPGPTLTLTGGFSPVQVIQANRGCSQTRSILSTDMGVFFSSDAGMFLIDRGLSVTKFGHNVTDTLTTYPIFTCAYIHPTENTFCWGVTDSIGTTGRRLVYDYHQKMWAIDKLSNASGTNVSMTGAAASGTDVLWISNLGVFYAETTDSYQDDGSWVEMRLETGNINLAGLLGFQRVWSFLLEYVKQTPASLSVQALVEDAQTTDTAVTWTGTELASLPSTGVLDYHVTNQRTRDIRFLFYDATPAGGISLGTGQGLKLVGAQAVAGVAAIKDKNLGTGAKK